MKGPALCTGSCPRSAGVAVPTVLTMLDPPSNDPTRPPMLTADSVFGAVERAARRTLRHLKRGWARVQAIDADRAASELSDSAISQCPADRRVSGRFSGGPHQWPAPLRREGGSVFGDDDLGVRGTRAGRQLVSPAVRCDLHDHHGHSCRARDSRLTPSAWADVRHRPYAFGSIGPCGRASRADRCASSPGLGAG